MGSPFDLAHVDKIWSQAHEYFLHHLLSWSLAAQVVVIGCVLLVAHKVSGAIRAWLTGQQTQYTTHPEACADLAILFNFVKVINVFIAFILVSIAVRIADHFSWPRDELYAVGIILIALTLTRLFTGKMNNRVWARILALALWIVASLYVFHLIDPGIVFYKILIFSLGMYTFPSYMFSGLLSCCWFFTGCLKICAYFFISG